VEHHLKTSNALMVPILRLLIGMCKPMPLLGYSIQIDFEDQE